MYFEKQKNMKKTTFSAQQEAKKHPSAQFLMCPDFSYFSRRGYVSFKNEKTKREEVTNFVFFQSCVWKKSFLKQK